MGIVLPLKILGLGLTPETAAGILCVQRELAGEQTLDAIEKLKDSMETYE